MTAKEVFAAMQNLDDEQADILLRLLFQRHGTSNATALEHITRGKAKIIPTHALKVLFAKNFNLDLALPVMAELRCLEEKNAKRHRPPEKTRNEAVVADWLAGMSYGRLQTKHKLTLATVRGIIRRSGRKRPG